MNRQGVIQAERVEKKWRGTYEGKKRYALKAHARGASNGRVQHLIREANQMATNQQQVNQPTDQQQIKLMLEAVLSMSEQQLTYWVHGWVGGSSSEGVPFIILYPKRDNAFLNNYICKVYEESFRKLPPFIPTSNVPNDTDSTPQKDKAIQRGIYNDCRPFKIVMSLGAVTDNGNRRKRLLGVLWYGKETAVSPSPQSAQPSQPVQSQPTQQDITPEQWFGKAQTASSPNDFDRYIASAIPFYQGDAKIVKKFRELMFPKWVGQNSAFVAKAMSTYADYRHGGTEHTEAKIVTLNWFSSAVGGAA